MKQAAVHLTPALQSSDQTTWRPYVIRAVSIIGVWALIAAFYSLITTFTMVNRGEQVMWLEAYGFELLSIWPWMVATPFIFKVAYTYRLSRPNLLKSISIHLLLALTIFFVHSVNQSLTVYWFFHTPVLNGYILTDFIFFFNTRFALYAGVVLLAYVLEFYKKNHDSRLKEARIKRQLNQAKFDNIKHRVQPFFVLRTLDAIDERMQHDPDHIKTDKMIADFSELLRLMLDRRGVRLILLEDDFNAIDLYVQLFNKRFNLHLECHLDVDSRSTQAAIPYGLYIISVFEYLANYHLDELKKIDIIYYQAHTIGDKLELKVIFNDLFLKDRNIDQLYRGTDFGELKAGLQTFYDKDHLVSLNSDKEGGGFYIELSVPYINYTKSAEEENRVSLNSVKGT